MTLREFISYFKEQHKLEITMLSQGVCMLYSSSTPSDRMDLAMSEVVKRVSEKDIEPRVKVELLAERGLFAMYGAKSFDFFYLFRLCCLSSAATMKKEKVSRCPTSVICCPRTNKRNPFYE